MPGRVSARPGTPGLLSSFPRGWRSRPVATRRHFRSTVRNTGLLCFGRFAAVTAGHAGGPLRRLAGGRIAFRQDLAALPFRNRRKLRSCGQQAGNRHRSAGGFDARQSSYACPRSIEATRRGRQLAGWQIAVAIALISWIGFLAPMANAGLLDEPHLRIVPRTGDEIARIRAVTEPVTDFSRPARFEARPAGAATVRVRKNANAFSDPSASLEFEGEMLFKVGNGLFRKLWVSAPSSTLASDGLGPLFNARSCQRCHIKDGRGHPPAGPEDNSVSFLLKVSLPGKPGDAGSAISRIPAAIPDPVYGNQIQDLSLIGHAAEGRIRIDYEEFEVALSEGETVFLRRPAYSVEDLGYGPLHPAAGFSPRVAPQMIGLGLLEAIPAADIVALSDPGDADGDGISGRPNMSWSRAHQQAMLGRFGWKASAATAHDQVANAFAADIGISTHLLPDAWGDCTEPQQEASFRAAWRPRRT